MSKAQIAGELIESGWARIASAVSTDSRLALLADASQSPLVRGFTSFSHSAAGETAIGLGGFEHASAGLPLPNGTMGSTLRTDGKLDIPALHVGKRAELNDTITTDPHSPLARLYGSVADSAVKIEFARVENGKLVAGAGSAVKIPYPGRFATAAHVLADASDATIVDRFGNVHEIASLKQDRPHDVAAIQLRNLQSFNLFKPVSLSDSNLVGDIPDETFAAITHPLAWNKLFLSQGTVKNPDFMLVDPPSIRYLMHIENGSSGGPIFKLNGDLVGIVSGRSMMSELGMRSTTDGATSNYLKRLLDSIPPEADRSVLRPVPLETVPARVYQIADHEAASAALKEILHTDSLSSPAPNYYHSVWQEATAAPDLSLTYRVSHNLGSNQIDARVVAVNGSRPDQASVWPNSKTRILDSRLTVQLDGTAKPLSVHVTEDPLSAMTNAVKLKGGPTYLSTLLESSHQRIA